MKAVFVFNTKRKTLDSFVYVEKGPMPPFVTPENPDEPKDHKPEPGARKRRRKERPS